MFEKYKERIKEMWYKIVPYSKIDVDEQGCYVILITVTWFLHGEVLRSQLTVSFEELECCGENCILRIIKHLSKNYHDSLADAELRNGEGV